MGTKGADPEKIETFFIAQLRSPISYLNSLRFGCDTDAG
jgi:hypothetical protein